MIAKEIAARSTGGSFRGLVSYLTKSQGKQERVGTVRLGNCVSSDAESAILEVENTQARNHRARQTTYHLMLAFPPGEEPSEKALEEIERRACEALGFADHQRVSVVHHDTDHLHLHVAINRVHPRTANAHCPSFSKLVLDRVCVELETDYGLQAVRHRARDRQTGLVASDGAAVPTRRPPDMERMSGLESLIGFVQRECADDLRAARSWAEVHEVAAAHGLSARLRGNGLVFVAANGTAVKASSVSRELSKGALEGRLGSFDGAVAGTAARTQYRKLPLSRGAAALLYEKYRQECPTVFAGRGQRMASPDAQQSRDQEHLRARSHRRWAAIRLVAKGRVAWILWSAYARHADRRERERLRQRLRARRRAVAAQDPRPRWLDWLRDRAVRGDAEALSALRARGPSRASTTARSVWGDTRSQWVPPMRPDSATATGTLIYRVPGGSIRDAGNRLHLTQSASSDAAADALIRLAYARFGSRIGIDGDTVFCARLERAAAAASLPITFFGARVGRQSFDLQQKKDLHAAVRRERGRSR